MTDNTRPADKQIGAALERLSLTVDNHTGEVRTTTPPPAESDRYKPDRIEAHFVGGPLDGQTRSKANTPGPLTIPHGSTIHGVRNLRTITYRRYNIDDSRAYYVDAAAGTVRRYDYGFVYNENDRLNEPGDLHELHAKRCAQLWAANTEAHNATPLPLTMHTTITADLEHPGWWSVQTVCLVVAP